MHHTEVFQWRVIYDACMMDGVGFRDCCTPVHAFLGFRFARKQTDMARRGAVFASSSHEIACSHANVKNIHPGFHANSMLGKSAGIARDDR